MEFNFNLEGGNFSRAGAASSEIKKILKQLNVDALLIKRIVVALYEAEGYAGRLLDRFARSPGNGIRCRDGITQYEKKL